MRGRPFEPGNKAGRGRPLGSRNKSNQFAEEFQKDGLRAIQKNKLQAFNGNQRAIDIWLDRLAPRLKPPNSRFRLPSMRTPADLAKVLPAVLQAIASGKINAQEGEAIARIIESQAKVLEMVDFHARLQVVEQRTNPTSSSIAPAQVDVNDGDREQS